MDKTNAHLYLPLVQALADGKTIQLKNSLENWCDISGFDFSLPPESYRIKPETIRCWFRVAKIDNGKGCEIATCPFDEMEIEKKFVFIQWLTDRIYYEVDA